MTRPAAIGCETCGMTVSVGPLGRVPRFCSAKCRRYSYGGRCVECGAHTEGSAGPGKAAERCGSCSRKTRDLIWTSGAVLLAIQEWAYKYGDPPTQADWNAWHCRNTLGDEERAQRFEREFAAGTCPWFTTVVERFGSWNVGIRAAGFTPRADHGGGGNEARTRSMRAKRERSPSTVA